MCLLKTVNITDWQYMELLVTEYICAFIYVLFLGLAFHNIYRYLYQ